ncbi:hypothetical protein DSO57_1011734 [Entomophthora muscae]|uniref:Uncharacterized protein n=1 Tax=Entomophthora muscae TaxID=34485 RepID=A0ACC2T625_9FUNG|nr:hypothetical protein DSO57_1011734 [Entomophthora muscae]
MDYQPGPDPGMTGIPYDSPVPPIPQPYNHSRAGMVILTILSLAKVVIPNLGAYRPLAAGLLYLACSAPFLYWALVTQYHDELSSPFMPWYMTASGYDTAAPAKPAQKRIPDIKCIILLWLMRESGDYKAAAALVGVDPKYASKVFNRFIDTG